MIGTSAGDVNIFVRCFRNVIGKYEITVLVEQEYIKDVMTCFGKIKLISIAELTIDCFERYLKDYSGDFDILMPSGFESIKFVTSFKDRLACYINIIELPEMMLIEELDDKLSFFNFCTTHKLPHPETVSGQEFFEKNIFRKKFPILLKHRKGAGKQGIRLVDSPEDLQNGSEYIYAEDYIVQEYLQGCDFAFNAFCKNGLIVAWTVQQFTSVNILGRDRLRLSTFVKNTDLYLLADNLINLTHYSGPINIDFRYVPTVKKYYFIEVNPRFWANTHYSLIDGVNFVDIALRSNPSADIMKPLCSGKTWGKPVKTLILIIFFLKFDLIRCLLSQSMLQFKVDCLDRLDNLFSRYMAVRVETPKR